MSKVKLVVRKRRSLSGYRIIDLEVPVSNDTQVEAIVQTDFDVEENGERQVSENFDPVITIENMNNLNGRLLTIADAAFQDPEQRKAVKDLLGKAAWDWYHAIEEYPSRYYYEEKKKDQKVD